MDPMATWVIGDIHGNLAALERLLETLSRDPDGELRIWLTGDLVNRGPDSLGVLRWAARSPLVEAAVLGNHDLKLLACAAGVLPPGARDTFGDVLEAPDREELLHWLRHRPLVHRRGRHLLVHAGLLPSWETARAVDLSRQVEAVLTGPGATAFLGSGRWRRPAEPGPGPDTVDRLATVAGVLAGLRIVDASGRPHPSFTGGLADIPPGHRPWFEASRAVAEGTTVLFGHWARLGFFEGPGVRCLDGGAAYGGHLVALCLDDGRVIRTRA